MLSLKKSLINTIIFLCSSAFTLSSLPLLSDRQKFSMPPVSVAIAFSKRNPKGHTYKIGLKHGSVMQMFYAKIFFSFIVL